MRIPLLCLLAATLCLSSCDDAPPSEGGGGEVSGGGGGAVAGGGGGSTGGGGGGQVKVGSEQDSKETITDRYTKALESIKKRDWDGAREQLVEALHRSEGHPIEKNIREHLEVVEGGILSQPTHNVHEVFSNAKNLYEKKVSVRGIYFSGGKVGQVTYYFFVQTGRNKMQVRYPKLGLEEKKTIMLLKDGAQVLVRGTLKTPWGSNPDPYMEASYFRLERLSKDQEAEMKAAESGGQN